MAKKILHVLPDSTYSQYFFKLIKNYPGNFFVLYDYKNKFSDIPCLFKKKPRSRSERLFKLLDVVNKYDHVFFHSIDNMISICFFARRGVTFHWIIWGGDLYSSILPPFTLRKKIGFFIKKVGLIRFKHVHTALEGDVSIARKLYNKKLVFNRFVYPTLDESIPFDIDLALKNRGDGRKKIKIQIGNSADPSNNHLEVFRAIKGHLGSDFEILCPLSYGDQDYATNVIRVGKEMWGDSFRPLTDFMSYEDYVKELSSVDCLILNHKRQQGLGNLNLALSLGAKVFVRSDTTTYKDYSSMGFKVYDTKKILRECLPSDFIFSAKTAVSNRDCVFKNFSTQKSRELWEKIYYECMR